MRSVLNLFAGCCLLALVACSSQNPPSTVNPGMVGGESGQTCPASCTDAASPAALKATGDCGACPYSSQTGDASLGGVGDKSGCCSSKDAGASLGAVGGSECGAAKSACPASNDAGASLGAVSDDKGCCSKSK